ncbi:UDP-N-acetylmuramoyl-L-alanine--D-glutamate ligase [Candidatus Saccharibacteria bacterium]|nr:UDP-N-acetylmuramoyl-L-alanine--D-glutamate ligase [Candidatus Saccharibacteria bacterium]
MKIAILGYGVEGKAIENYFKTHPYDDPSKNLHVEPTGLELTVFDKFDADNLPDLSSFDVVFRSPSVRPPVQPDAFELLKNPSLIPEKPVWTSSTRYFYNLVDRNHIIGITGTKGKGTTCSITTALLKNLGYRVHLVGNIGTPAITALDNIIAEPDTDYFVVYEMSSFQLWDLEKSPHVAAVLRISPDHLDVHRDFNDYVNAKSNIARHQVPGDYCIYYVNNADSVKTAEYSDGDLIPYPLVENREKLDKLLDNLQIPGAHNRENAEAALEVVAAALKMTLDQLINAHHNQLTQALHDFKALPHRIQFVRELNQVSYYDDNYSSALPATEVAIKTFADRPVVLIAGGKDRHLDLTNHKKIFFESPNVKKVILIGELKQQLAEGVRPEKYDFADSLAEAVEKARFEAEKFDSAVVLMSPGAASFDMFENFGDRGDKFQAIVRELK